MGSMILDVMKTAVEKVGTAVLATVAQTLSGAVNELKGRLDGHDTSISTINSSISTINSKIPAQASSSKKLVTSTVYSHITIPERINGVLQMDDGKGYEVAPSSGFLCLLRIRIADTAFMNKFKNNLVTGFSVYPTPRSGGAGMALIPRYFELTGVTLDTLYLYCDVVPLFAGGGVRPIIGVELYYWYLQ